MRKSKKVHNNFELIKSSHKQTLWLPREISLLLFDMPQHTTTRYHSTDNVSVSPARTYNRCNWRECICTQHSANISFPLITFHTFRGFHTIPTGCRLFCVLTHLLHQIDDDATSARFNDCSFRCDNKQSRLINENMSLRPLFCRAFGPLKT